MKTQKVWTGVCVAMTEEREGSADVKRQTNSLKENERMIE